MAAVALEVLRARAERAVEVEGGDRPAGALPLALVRAAGDPDDRAAEALDEARGDDPDHALVPVGAREDVGAAPLQRLRPGRDLGDRRAQDPVLDALPLAVQLLEACRGLLGLRLVAREDEVERAAGVAEPSGGVDARPEAEADGA